MKRILLFFAVLVTVLGLNSCGNKDDYKAFVGTWGVDRIDYYNIDYAGDPIPASFETYTFTPGDPDNGIDLVFREDRTGEMRDRSRDSLAVPVYEGNEIVDTAIIICPDTTLITRFTYSYHDDDALLYMNMEVEHPFTYKMRIELLTDESFIYVNQYKKYTVEKARLIRLSNDVPDKGKAPKPTCIPHKPGSMFGNY